MSDVQLAGSALLRTVWAEEDCVCVLDQTLLPGERTVVRCASVAEVAEAIRSMRVRGAPAIGCTAAFGMALCAARSPATTTPELLEHLDEARHQLNAARPTAVNLAWATERLIRVAREAGALQPQELRERLRGEAQAVFDEDLEMCRAIGRHGAVLIPARGEVLTHCNAGALATSGYGTALAPIRVLHEQGRPVHVLVDETRPFLQGARLTAWELQEDGIDLTLITDNMAGYFMRRGDVDCVLVGADRIVANGDVANKIGTYSLAVLARAHGIPFYVAAPSSTVDLSLVDGDAIPIEERDPSEVTSIRGVPIAPVGVRAAHPAFDVTPHALVTAIITEQGVLYPPYGPKLAVLFESPSPPGPLSRSEWSE